MNNIYKIIWSVTHNNWIVTSEKAKGKIKSSKRSIQRPLISAALLTSIIGIASGAESLLITNTNQNYPGDGISQPNGNGIDTLENGVVYNQEITGNRDVIFTAPEAKYNPTRVSSGTEVNYYDVPEDLRHRFSEYGIKMPYGNPVFNTGKDDRYGRKILLDGSHTNSFEGNVIVKDNAQLTVGRDPETSHQLLGDNNDLFVEGYSTVSIYSKEKVNNLIVDAQDATVIRRSDDDPDLWFFPNIDDVGADDRFYAIENVPPGGSVTINQGAELVVTGDTKLTGNRNFNTYLNTFGADMTLEKEATFDRGNLGVYDGSKVVAEKGLTFTGLYSGFIVRDSSLDVKSIVKKISTDEFGSSNTDGVGDFTITNNAQVTFHENVLLNDSILNINDGNTFYHGSHPGDHLGQAPELNKPVSPWYEDDRNKKSSVIAKKDIILTGDKSEFSLIGSDLTVEGDFINKTQDMKFFTLGGELTVKGDKGLSFEAAANAVLLATDFDLSTMTVSEGGKVLAAANDLKVKKNFVLEKDAQFIDATTADGSEKGGRLHFPGDDAHHGLTFGELANVMKGKSSDGQGYDDKPVFDVEKIGSLTIGGNAVLKENALYEANGNVEVVGELDLHETSNFFVQKGDAKIHKGTEIAGKIGIDNGHTFSFESGTVGFKQDQSNILGTLAINGAGTKLAIKDRKLNDTHNSGTILISEGAIFEASGNNTISNLHNRGAIYVGSAVEGSQNGMLTIEGNYSGADGSVLYFGNLDARKENYNSPMDYGHKNILWVQGNADGKSEVRFTQNAKLSNLGFITDKGILLAQIDGHSDLSLSMAKDQRLTDGGTEYALVGRAGPDTLDSGQNSWYLSNEKFDGTLPLTPIEPIKPDVPLTPLEPSTPIKPDVPLTPLEPSTPIKPDVPLTPLEPSTPIKPDVPLTPLEPSTPIKPDVPLTPLEPSTPIKPDVPLTPLEPSTPIKPDVPLTPLEPSTPIEDTGTCLPRGGVDVASCESESKPKPKPKPEPKKEVYIPETSAYLANLIAANEMYTLKYHEKQYLDGYDGVWSRLKGSFTSFKLDNDQDLSANIDMFTLHLGRDLWHNNKLTLGVMAAYGYTTGKSQNAYNERKADHNSQGFALGAYGSYEFNENSYIDTWVQYVFMRNKVYGFNTPVQKYNLKGLTASIEAGYAFEVNDTFRIQPQAQFIWMGVKDKVHADSRGTKVQSRSNNLQSRIGVRFYNDGENYIPFAEVNYIHNSKKYNVNFEGELNQNKFTASGSKNLYRLELGMTTKPKDGWTASGSISYTQGGSSYRNTSFKIDLRYDF